MHLHSARDCGNCRRLPRLKALQERWEARVKLRVSCGGGLQRRQHIGSKRRSSFRLILQPDNALGRRGQGLRYLVRLPAGHLGMPRGMGCHYRLQSLPFNLQPLRLAVQQLDVGEYNCSALLPGNAQRFAKCFERRNGPRFRRHFHKDLPEVVIAQILHLRRTESLRDPAYSVTKILRRLHEGFRDLVRHRLGRRQA